MSDVHNRIQASRASLGSDVAIGANSIVRADEVVLGKSVRIADNVDITCDRLELHDGCSIGPNTTILSPEVVLGPGCVLGGALHAELNEHFRMGGRSTIAERVRIVGQGLESGEFLWVESDVLIGGGGARGPRSYLTVGDRTSIFARCYVNLSERVHLGSFTALSYGVVVLTHGAWQPALMGYSTRFAPVSVGSYVVVYVNSVVLPGVSIGDYATVGAASVVTRDVPTHCLAVGSPARIVKGPKGYPPSLDERQKDALIHGVLTDYATTLPSKGVRIVDDALASRQRLTVQFEGRETAIAYIPPDADPTLHVQADITLALGPLPPQCTSQCHMDLASEILTGEPTALAEDLRDYLRRRMMRVSSGQPFRSLPLANLQRLNLRRKGQSR